METTSAGAERTEPGDSEQDEEGDVYEVERIVDKRTEKGEVLYRVRWKNYTSDDDTWEPEAHLADCQEVLLAYQRRVADTRKDPTQVEQVQAQVLGCRAGHTICSLAAAPQGIVGIQQQQQEEREEHVMNNSLDGSCREPPPQKLPMKSDLFDADSESEGDTSKREEQLPKKKKKKKKKSKGEEEPLCVEPVQRESKKKNRRKDREQWKPLPGPESNGNDSEEPDDDGVPSVAPPKKSTQTKKRPLLSDEDEEQDIPVVPKQHAKDKSKDGGKAKKEGRTDARKKITKRKDEETTANMEEEEEAAAIAEDDLNSEAPSESASMQTDDTTANESYEPPEVPLRLAEEGTAKAKKSKPVGLKLQSIKALIQEKRKKKAATSQATPPLRESAHHKLRTLLSKAGRSTDDEHTLPSSDSSDATISVRHKGKAKGQEGSVQKPSAPVPTTVRPRDAEEPKADGTTASSAPHAKKQKEAVEKEASASTNLFEKFLLNCEAKDRVPRRHLVHTPSSDTRGELKNKAGKAEKRTKAVKEVAGGRSEAERAHREVRSPEASQHMHSPLEAEERLGRADSSPEGKEHGEKAESSTKEAVRGRPDDELTGRARTTSSPDNIREKKGKLEEVCPEAAEEPSAAPAAGRWKEKRKRKREGSEPRVYAVCDESREPREATIQPEKPVERAQASLNLGVDLKLDWMTLEDFQKHLNGEDEVLSAATISPGELRDAVKSGDYLAVKLALNSKEEYNLDQEDSSGMSLAMLAAVGGQDDILRLLIKKGARVNSRQKTGSTALMHAAEKNFLTTAAILLEAGAHVNAQTGVGETALMKACKRGNAEIVRLLLECGADCNTLCKHNKNNAMHFAKLSNNVMMYDYIKEHVATLSSVAEETIRAYFETRLAVLEPIFPLACHRLCEGPDFSLEFNYKAPAHSPAEGSGILLFIFHANFLSEITARLCGPCSVHAVVLNDKFQLPVFLDSHFIYSFSPVPGTNKLFIRLAEAPTAKVKLLICAYRVQLQ